VDLTAERAGAPVPRGILAALRAPIDAPLGTAIAGIGLAGLALLLCGPVPKDGPVFPHVFEYLFFRNEPAAAWLAIAILVSGLLLARSSRLPERPLVSRLASDPRFFIAGATLVLAAAALLVYRAHPLSMDEYAPLFQARVFARGRLDAQVPKLMLPRLLPPIRWFIEFGPEGAMLSGYSPGFALLLTPFVWLGCPWLLNPLLGGATLALAWHLARRLWPGTAAPGWALLFTAASPAFSVNAISYYTMGAHLAASLAFAALALEGRFFLAGLVGSLALALHNPFPHALFALPWVAWIAWRPGRVRNLIRLAAGYLPGLLLIVGWIWHRGQVTRPAQVSRGIVAGLAAVRQDAFALPGWDLLFSRIMNLAELASWAAPLLLPLAVLGALRCWKSVGVKLLVASALATLLGYSFVTFDQAHGWGFRYFHPAWAVLPLLGAGAVESERAGPALRRLAAWAALCSLLLCTPLRFGQVRTFIDRHLAQIPPAGGGREIVFIDVAKGTYTVDLVQNDPFLESDRWLLISFGEREDREFMAAFFPRSRRTLTGTFGSVWKVE
jgi:hypothetical protein